MSLIMPISDWPVQDKHLWDTLTRAGTPFDDHGALAHLRATSKETLANRYGRWLEWLRRHAPDALREPPCARVTLVRLRAWLSALDHTTRMTQLMFVDGVLRVAFSADPERDWSREKRLLAALKRLAKGGDPARKHGRILSSQVLLDAGLALAGPQADATANDLQRALKQRDGAMIAFLAMMPMRLRALAGLEIGTSLHVGAEVISVELCAEMTKTGVPWEADLPEPAATALRRYIDTARPFLMARGNEHHQALWVEKKGAPMKQVTIRHRIAEKTLALTDIRIPAHFFRDSAATTLAREHSDAARLIRPVLAHSGFETAEKHYIQAQGLDALRAYEDVLREIKRSWRR